MPYFLSFISNTLSIVIPRSDDNGGNAILTYELWLDSGNNFTSNFINLTSYTSNSIIYQATTLNDGLKPGYIYRMQTRSLNNIGYS